MYMGGPCHFSHSGWEKGTGEVRRLITNRGRAYGYTVTAVLLWSTVATAFKIGLEYMESGSLLLFSAGFSFAALGVVLALRRKKITATPGIVVKGAVFGLLNPFLYYLILFKAYSLLPAQEAQPLNFTWPIVLVLLSTLFLGERLSARDILAMLLCFLGAWVVCSHGVFTGLHFSSIPGTVLALGSSLFWAVYWILNRTFRGDKTLLLFFSFLSGTIYTAVFLGFTGGLRIPDISGLAACLYIGLFEMGLTFLIWSKALEYTESAVLVSNLLYLAPFISLLFISLILGERIAPSNRNGTPAHRFGHSHPENRETGRLKTCPRRRAVSGTSRMNSVYSFRAEKNHEKKSAFFAHRVTTSPSCITKPAASSDGPWPTGTVSSCSAAAASVSWGPLAKAVKERGGRVYGVIPSCLRSGEGRFSLCDTLVLTGTLAERKKHMMDIAEGFAVLPGGYGTLDEAFEVLTLRRHGVISQPVVFLNTNGFFDLSPRVPREDSTGGVSSESFVPGYICHRYSRGSRRVSRGTGNGTVMSFERIIQSVVACGGEAVRLQKHIDRNFKQDGSIITEADHAVDRMLTDTIQSTYPGALLISEESRNTPPARKASTHLRYRPDRRDRRVQPGASRLVRGGRHSG